MVLQHGPEQLHQLAMLLELLELQAIQAIQELRVQVVMEVQAVRVVLRAQVAAVEPLGLLEAEQVHRMVRAAARVVMEEQAALEHQHPKAFRLCRWVLPVVLVVQV